MGVDRTDYLMIAYDIGCEAFDEVYTSCEDVLDSGEPFDIVYDGMCGEYCYVGKILKTIDPETGPIVTQLDDINKNIDKEELAQFILSYTGIKISPDDFKKIILSHYW